MPPPLGRGIIPEDQLEVVLSNQIFFVFKK